MTSFRDDNFVPPDGWQPSETDRQQMRNAPALDLDLHLGGKEEEESGLRWLEKQRKTGRDEPLHLRQEAETQLRVGAPDKAIGLLERARAAAPDDRDLLLTLSDAYGAAQRSREAAQVLQEVIASFGGGRTKELALYHHKLGAALARLGDTELALRQLDTALTMDPGAVGVLKDLGVLALETNDLARAQRTFRTLLLRLESNAGISKGQVFYYLCEISAKQGNKAEATQMFERAVESDPGLVGARAKLSELKR
jgi:tetratricopeptide (TPR) repeat protein